MGSLWSRLEGVRLKGRQLNDQRGFTLAESLMALFFSTLFIVVILLIVYVGFSKVGVLEADGEVLRFEQNLVRFVESDFREHRVIDIREGDTADVKLYMDLVDSNGENKSVRYENRGQGFYRVDGDKSFLISKHFVNKITVSDRTLTVEYSVDGYDKTVVMSLVK